MITIAASEDYDWLRGVLVRRRGTRHRVDELLPPGYQRHLRVLEPWSPEHSPLPRRAWRELAARAGVRFYPEITWSELHAVTRDPAIDPSAHLYSDPDPYTRGRVAEHLQRATGPYWFAYDLGASIVLNRQSPLVIRSDELRLEAIRAAAAMRDTDAEHWWPADRSWVVSCDYDLADLYIACNDEIAERLLTDATVEAVEVRRDSRVDWTVDEERRPPLDER